VISGHALYVTILILILNFSFLYVTLLAGSPAPPIRSRCSSGSEERALRPCLDCWLPNPRRHRIVSQDGGGGDMKQMNLNEFLVQPGVRGPGGALDVSSRSSTRSIARIRSYARAPTAARIEPVIISILAASTSPWSDRHGPTTASMKAREHCMKEAKGS